MTVEHRKGDIFAQPDVEAVGHGVNCHGVMGSGIAVLFRKRWEAMYQAYRAACQAGELKLGELFPWRVEGDPQYSWVYNLASQYHPGPDASYEGVRSSVTAMLEHMEAHGVASVALPWIGSGIGGLEWERVSAIIEELAGDAPQHVVLVEFAP